MSACGTSTDSGGGAVEGSACAKQDDCPDSYRCDLLDDSCKPHPEGGVCVKTEIECGHVRAERGCQCDGDVGPLDCIDLFSDAAADPQVCSNGTFQCGDLSCARYTEYCLETTHASGSTFECVSAAPQCASGISDCMCLGPELCGEKYEEFSQGQDESGCCYEGDDEQVHITVAGT